MDAGKLSSSIELLEIEDTPDGCRWTCSAVIWAKAEKKNARVIYSLIGRGADITVLFTIRRRDISRHNAIIWQGQHHFICDVAEDGRGHLKITTVPIDAHDCIAKITGKPTRNERNNPVPGTVSEHSFPACVTEKFIGYTEPDPNAVNTVTLVLITPKRVTLDAGTVVTVTGGEYHITKCHTLDNYENEYEIIRREDL